MKELPEKFQFRHKRNKGFTHSCKRNAHGDYEVTWARGWAEFIRQVPWRVADSYEVHHNVLNGDWIIVDDVPKQKDALPDEFYFTCDSDVIPTVYKAYKNEGVYKTTWQGMKSGYTPTYPEEFLKMQFDRGNWKIINKPSLTAEQQQQVNQFKEQIAQLDSSIKLNEQDIEHKNRLIDNYKARQDDLRKKIEEIEGKA